VHARNYADLPLFDLIFGTFYNPRDFAPQAGLYDGASTRVWDMLRFRDVSSAQPQAVEINGRLRPALGHGDHGA
jgi:hypothetical protein